MKILVIISSFRKKNTYNTVKKIEEIHQEYIQCEYEYVWLKDLNLKTCIGCHACLTKGEDHCPLKDDLNMVIRKMEEADAVILASPNHVMNVNWLMKNFIDRISYMLHRPRFFEQRFMLLITSGNFMGTKKALNALSPIASGGKIISRFSVMNMPGMGEKKQRKQQQRLESKARKFALEMNRQHIFKATLANMLWFSAFKATTHSNNENFQADAKYYEDKQFFADMKLNIFQKSFIKLGEKFFLLLVSIGIV